MRTIPRLFSPSFPSSIFSQRPSLHLPSTHLQSHLLIPPNHHLQTRHVTSTRRHRKLLNLPPAPFYGGPIGPPTGASGRSKAAKQLPDSDPFPEGDHIVFNPPASAPNVYHTPRKFLPKTDMRLTLNPLAAVAAVAAMTSSTTVRTSSSSSTATATATATPPAILDPGQWPADRHLPPPISPPYTKKYHITPPQMEEMRRLRRSNEKLWTRQRLAERFECSQLFVGMVVQCSDERLEEVERERERAERRWGPRRRLAREEARRRRAEWGREE